MRIYINHDHTKEILDVRHHNTLFARMLSFIPWPLLSVPQLFQLIQLARPQHGFPARAPESATAKKDVSVHGMWLVGLIRPRTGLGLFFERAS